MAPPSRPHSRANDPEHAQEAKRKLVARIGEAGWCRGVGLAPGKGGGFSLRVNVDPERADEADLPEELDGVPIQVVRISGYRARGGAPGKQAKPSGPAKRPGKKKA